MKKPVKALQIGPRIHLRFPIAGDRTEMLALKRASRLHLARWEATPENGVDSFSAAWFARFLKSSKTDRSLRFLICLNQTGEIAGQLGLGEIARGAFQSCYLGYWIGAPYARQGLMTEAVTLALNHAFKTLKLHRVEANIVPANLASKALARTLGFRYEGTAKRYLRIAGKWTDHEHWAITREEW